MFHSDVYSWNVVAITTRETMFHTASVSNSNVSSWDLAAVIYIEGLRY